MMAKAKKAKRARKRPATKWAPIPRSKATNAYDLLADVCKVILKEPKRYDQSQWIEAIRDIYVDPRRAKQDCDKAPACGTVACVAGWVTTLKISAITPQGEKELLDKWDVEEEAKKLLGISDSVAWELFDSEAVSDMAHRKNRSTPKYGTLAYAKLGVEHIQQFMERYAEQLKAHAVPR